MTLFIDGWGRRCVTDHNGYTYTEAEIARDMEGFEEEARIARAKEAALLERARAAAALRLGVKPEQVGTEDLELQREWLWQVEHAQEWPAFAMLELPPSLRRAGVAYYTDHRIGERLRHYVQVNPNGIVGRGALTGREEALGLLTSRLGCDVETLRPFLLCKNPAYEPWMVEGWRARWDREAKGRANAG